MSDAGKFTVDQVMASSADQVAPDSTGAKILTVYAKVSREYRVPN